MPIGVIGHCQSSVFSMRPAMLMMMTMNTPQNLWLLFARSHGRECDGNASRGWNRTFALNQQIPCTFFFLVHALIIFVCASKILNSNCTIAVQLPRETIRTIVSQNRRCIAYIQGHRHVECNKPVMKTLATFHWCVHSHADAKLTDEPHLRKTLTSSASIKCARLIIFARHIRHQVNVRRERSTAFVWLCERAHKLGVLK